jgi:hypothetical protein
MWKQNMILYVSQNKYSFWFKSIWNPVRNPQQAFVICWTYFSNTLSFLERKIILVMLW